MKNITLVFSPSAGGKTISPLRTELFALLCIRSYGRPLLGDYSSSGIKYGRIAALLSHGPSALSFHLFWSEPWPLFIENSAKEVTIVTVS